jgi:cellobiose dehydrogenase (acceptor)
MLLRSLLAVGTLVSSAFAVAYNESGWSFEGVVDASNGLTIGFTFPPDAEQPASGAEFIGHVAATASTSRWLGIALGGKMVNNTLLIAWPNGQNITSSVRRAS